MSVEAVDAFLAGRLDAVEAAAGDRLFADPAVLVEQARLDALLRVEAGHGEVALRRAVLATVHSGGSGRLQIRVLRTLRRRRALRWTLAAAAVLALAVGAWALIPAAGPAAEVLIADDGGALRRPGDRLDAGDGTRELRGADGSAYRLCGGSLALDAEGRLRLDRGLLAVVAAKRPAGRPLVVATPEAAIEVVGTRFALAVDGAGTLIDVTEGAVRLRGPEAITVAAGEWVAVEDGGLRRGRLADRPAPSAAADVPRDDPVAARYGGAYPWTAAIPWDRVWDLRDVPGDDLRSRLRLAQDAARAAGGGVVHVPAGTWTADGPLALRSRVVLRGAPPGPDGVPRSRIVFPDRAGAGIVNRDGGARACGVVDLDLDGGGVALLPELAGDDGGVDGWRDATAVLGMGERKLVLGCRVRHATALLPVAPGAPDGWPHPFATAIAVYSDADVLVAGNEVARAERDTPVRLDLAKRDGVFAATVPYPYDQRYGIDVNRLRLGAVAARGTGAQLQRLQLAPVDFPWFFRRGLVIRDNRIAVAGRAGIVWSGRGDDRTPGSGTAVLGNRIEMAAGSVHYTADGRTLRTGSGSNENRGLDQIGWASRVEGNRMVVHRQRTVDGGWTGDGEALIHLGTTDARLDLWRGNDGLGGEGGEMLYHGLRSIEGCVIEGNRARGIHARQIGRVAGNRVEGNVGPVSGLVR